MTSSRRLNTVNPCRTSSSQNENTLIRVGTLGHVANALQLTASCSAAVRIVGGLISLVDKLPIAA